MKTPTGALKSIALAAIVAAGTPIVANAGDNSMSIWHGDSYAAFAQARSSAVLASRTGNAPTFARDGVSISEYAARSSSSGVWRTPEVSANSVAALDDATGWREGRHNGFAEREYQALSASTASNVWQLNPGDMQAIEAEDAAMLADRPFRDRLARALPGSPAGILQLGIQPRHRDAGDTPPPGIPLATDTGANFPSMSKSDLRIYGGLQQKAPL